jgi:hypothetical protein
MADTREHLNNTRRRRPIYGSRIVRLRGVSPTTQPFGDILIMLSGTIGEMRELLGFCFPTTLLATLAVGRLGTRSTG